MDYRRSGEGWRSTGNLPSPRYGLRGASVGGVFHVTGGRAGGFLTKSVLVWDPISMICLGPNKYDLSSEFQTHSLNHSTLPQRAKRGEKTMDKIKETKYYQEPTQHLGECCLGEIWSKAGEMIEARQFHALVEVQLAQVSHLCAMNTMNV